jgi:hypothetical protein
MTWSRTDVKVKWGVAQQADILASSSLLPRVCTVAFGNSVTELVTGFSPTSRLPSKHVSTLKRHLDFHVVDYRKQVDYFHMA